MRRLTPTRRVRATTAALVALASLAAGAGAYAAGSLARVEQGALQLRMQIRGPLPAGGVAMVAIDETTFSDLDAQWPFDRRLHARVIDRLRAAGAREIVYDVQFTEPTRPASDLALYDAIGRAGGAVLATTEIARGHSNVLGGDANLARVHARAAASSLPVEPGGVITHFPHSVDGLKSVAVVAAERLARHPLPRAAFDGDGAWIAYRGGPGTVPSVRFSDVYRGRFDRSVVRGKVVVIGATTPSLQDVHATPASGTELMAGPEVQANAIWTALHGFPLRSAPALLELALIALAALLVPLARIRMRVSRAALLTPAAAVLLAAADQVAFDGGLVLAVVPPFVALALSTIATVIASHLAESRLSARMDRRNADLEQVVRERTEDLRQTQLEVIARLGHAAESRDGDTGQHIERMSHLCHGLGVAAGLSEEDALVLLHASAMHDIGKIGIPDRILCKPGRLTPEEWEVMKTHSVLGAEILGGSRWPLLQMAETIALTHHERWDGGGYPAGLAGEDIPLVGRIAAICDVFDALVSARPYKRPWPLEDALAEIRRQSGRQFDPRLVGLFLALEPNVEGGERDPAAAVVRGRSAQPQPTSTPRVALDCLSRRGAGRP